MGTSANEHHPLGDYLRQIEGYPNLDRDRELLLARRYLERGDRRARDIVICAHLRDVVAIARRYLGYGQPLGELIAAGNLGLVRALDRFDPDRGLRFMTYASYRVRAEILEHVVSSWSAVGLGKSSIQRRLFFGLRRARARHQAAGLDDAALVRALAEEFDCAVVRIELVLARLDRRDASLERLGEGGAGCASGYGSDPETQCIAEQHRARIEPCLARALAQLDERERAIVERRYLHADPKPSSRVELGAELGISGERVRQIEHRAIAKLRGQCQRAYA